MQMMHKDHLTELHLQCSETEEPSQSPEGHIAGHILLSEKPLAALVEVNKLRASTNNNLFIPLSRTNSGLCTFYASANRLWNTLDDGTRSISTLRDFKKYISNKYVVNNSKLDQFTIHRIF